MSMIDALHQGLRYAHVAAGFVGLALFWVPVFAKKGGRLHVRAGWAFACCAGFVGVTGLAASAWALVDIQSFAGARMGRIPVEERPRILEEARFLYAILGYLSLAVVSGLWFGLRVVRTRQRHEALRTPLVIGLHAATLLWALGLLALGASNLVAGYTGTHLPPGAANKYWVPAVLGLLGALAARDDLRYVLRPRPTRMAWWYKHMENMLGVGIAFHTAFLVFGVHRLFAVRLSGAWQLLPWVLPAAIGVPAIHVWVRAYQRRFGELPEKSAPREPSAEEPAEVNAAR
jgi:hypothetical protein